MLGLAILPRLRLLEMGLLPPDVGTVLVASPLT